MLKINTRVSFKEYLKLLLNLTYRRPIMIVIVSFAFLMLMWVIGYYTDLIELPKPAYFQYFTLTLIIIVQPLVIYSTIWRNYYSSNHLREKLEIDFTNKDIKLRGESFYTELTWEKIFKVDELGNYFLIYQNNLSAIIVPKKSFLKNQEEEFKQILESIHGVPINLKNNSNH